MIKEMIKDIIKWVVIIFAAAAAFYVVYPKYEMHPGWQNYRFNKITGEGETFYKNQWLSMEEYDVLNKAELNKRESESEMEKIRQYSDQNKKRWREKTSNRDSKKFPLYRNWNKQKQRRGECFTDSSGHR